MSVEVLFAEPNDEEKLREILWEYGMDISGRIEDHLIVKEKDQVLAGGKIIEFEPNHFFLEVLGVKRENREQGLGGGLLAEIVRDPWKYCRNPLSKPRSGTPFRMATIARGQASGFYKKYGFEPCEFAGIPEPYRGQCDDCPEKEICNPVPMILAGG